jgi:hypothetical protein
MSMCKQCEKKPIYEFTNQRKLCANCFVRWFQKKVLYTIRKFEMIKNGDVVGYKKSTAVYDVVLEDVLKMFAEKGHVELVKLPNKKATKIAKSDTTDSVADEIVHEVVSGDLKKEGIKPKEGKIIRPLYLFLDKEVLLYAKLRGLKYKVEKKEVKDKLGKFVDELEKKHPEIRHAIVNGMLEIK